MKLPLNQLDRHLAGQLAELYLIASDEPLLLMEAADDIRRAALAQGYDERKVHFVDRSFRWETLAASSDSLSLFASKQIIEIRMATPRPGDAGGKALRALAEEPEPDTLKIVTIQSRLDKSARNSVWLRTIEKHGVLVEMPSVGRASLPRFIVARARKRGIRIDTDAAELLADRTEGNLLAADQELTKLALVASDTQVDAARVLDAVASSARYDVFRLSDALLTGNLERALIVLAGLRTEGAAPPLVLWAVVREISTLSQLKHAEERGRSAAELMNRMRIWQSRQGQLRQAMSRYSDAELARLLARAVEVDRAVKGVAAVPAWEAITALVIEMLAPRRLRQSA